jgi:hypothetical protein
MEYLVYNPENYSKFEAAISQFAQLIVNFRMHLFNMMTAESIRSHAV